MKKFTYDYEADWVVNRLCNFSCDYCAAENARETVGILSHTSEHYANFFSLWGRWMLRFSGGEPLIHSKTVDVMQAITDAGHYASLNTNLSQTVRVGQLCEKINPSQVEYINVAAHPKERRRKNDFQNFLSNLRQIKSAGFEVFVSVVMAPEVFGTLYEETRKIIYDATGVVSIPKALRTPDFPARSQELIGIDFPQSYTDAQRAQFREYAEYAAGVRPDLVESESTVNLFTDVTFLHGFPDFRGMGAHCNAGRQFFKIDELGKIWRCGGSEDQHGDIGLNWLRMNPEPKICREHFCPYYCLKYSDYSQVQK